MIAEENFRASQEEIKRFRKHNPIKYNEAGCGQPKNARLLQHGAEEPEWVQWPWAVKVFVKGKLCSGNMISRSVALTAGHCMGENVPHKDVFVEIFTGKSKSYRS